MYSQSPARTEVWLPHTTLIEGRPRRVLAMSMTSSWTSVAVWIISITAAMRVSPGLAGSGVFARRLGAQFAAQQNQDGAQPLASAGLQILADIGDRVHRGDGLQADLSLHLVEVFSNQVENLDGGECLADLAECHRNA